MRVILEVNTEKSIYIYIFGSHQHNAGQNHNIKTVNKSLKNVGSYNIWDNTNNAKLQAKEIMGILNLWNACSHLVQNVFSSTFLCMNIPD